MSGEAQHLGESEPGADAFIHAFSIDDTCCGDCPGDTCYVDGVTGA